MIRKGIRPEFRPGLDLPTQGEYRRVLPFPRNWKLILVLLLLDCVFLLPAWAAFQQAAEQWSKFDDLFDLVSAIFISAWLLGWSVVPLLLSAVLVVILGGREVVRASRHKLELIVGLPFFGLVSRYDPQAMRNLQRQVAPQKSGHSWRGSYLVFDYGANQIEFGSDLSISEASDIKLSIETACGISLRSGPATEQELAEAWPAIAPVKAPSTTTPLANFPAKDSRKSAGRRHQLCFCCLPIWCR